MDFEYSEEQKDLRESARSFLAEHSGPEQIRAAMQTPLGYDPSTWREISTVLGWPSVHIPEAYGGLGLAQVDLAILLEAMGETLLCAPFFSTVVLRVTPILKVAPCAPNAERRPPLAPGTQRAAQCRIAAGRSGA